MFFFISLILINLFLITLPLTNSLGYEFALANSLLFFLVGGLFVCSMQKETNYGGIFTFILTEYKSLFAIILIPFFLGSLSSILNSGCPIKDGLAFYLALPIPAMLLGIISGFIVSSLSKHFNRFIFIGLSFILLASTLLEFYFYPQVYFYNPIFGFFPGTIYDEDIAVNSTLVFHQLFNLVVFYLALLTISNSKVLRSNKFYKWAFTLIILATALFTKPFWGFATTTNKLQSELQNKISTEHFNIYLGSDVKKTDREFIALLHEYNYEQVLQKFNLSNSPKIESYIFNDKEQKRKLFGAGNADVSKPWMNKIFLNYTNYKQTLKHEIAHTVAAKFGVTPFKVADKLNMAMIEGLAMWIENDYDGYPVSFAAKLAFNNGYRISLQNLFNSGKFFSNYSSLAYIYSGAFLEFISNKFEPDKVLKLYGSLDFEANFGSNLSEISVEFEELLLDSSFSDYSSKAQFYFAGQTLFKKFCPRMASNDMKEAAIEYNVKNYQLAAEKYSKIYNYSSSAGSLLANSFSLQKLGEYNKSVDLLKKEINKFEKSNYLFAIELQLADSYLLAGDSLSALKYYVLIEKQNPSENYLNRVKLIKLLWQLDGIDSVKSFLVANETDRMNKLFYLYEKSKDALIIPYIISYTYKVPLKVEKVIRDFQKCISSADEINADVCILTSQYLLAAKKYEDAKKLAVIAVERSKRKENEFSAVENLRMVNWFYNFASETEVKFN